MKKICLTFFVLLFPLTSFASECSIEHKMSDSLSSYISNSNTVLKNISKSIKPWNRYSSSETFNKFLEEYYNLQDAGVGIFNQAFDYDTYFSSFEYQIIFPAISEVPKEFKRDYKALQKQGQKINRFIDFAIKSWWLETPVTNICSGVSNCNFPEGDIYSSLVRVLKNHEHITANFTNTIINSPLLYKNITLVKNNFLLELKTDYGKQMIENCSKLEDSFLYTIEAKIEQIGQENFWINSGIQTWIDSWNMAIGKNMNEYKIYEIESKILQKELARQWVSADNQRNMLESLRKYNIEWWFSENNNFIANSFRNTKNKITETLSEIKNENIWDFFEELWKLPWRLKKASTTSITDTQRAKRNSIISTKIKENIDTLYITSEAQLALWETITSDYQNSLLNIHLDISDSIDILQKTCKKAVKICNKQDTWHGKCWSCN